MIDGLSGMNKRKVGVGNTSGFWLEYLEDDGFICRHG